MTEVLRFILLGLGAGGLYVLSATGLVLIYRGSGVVNFAHGALGMVGAYTFWELSHKSGWPIAIAAIAGIGVSAALGALTHLLVMRPLRRSSVLLKVIATLAITAIVQAAAGLRYPMEVVVVEPFLPTQPWSLFGVTVGADRIVILVLVLVLTAALWAIYKFTNFGLATTATSENPRAAATLGLSPDRIAVANWAIGAGLSGMAGVFLVPIIGLSVTGLTLLVIPVLATAVVGRFSSFPLTLVAGLGIGALQSVATRWIPEAGVPGAIPFLIVAIVLISRGSRVPEKGEQGIRLPSVGSGRIRPLTLAIPIAVLLALVWFVMSPVWLDAVTVQLAVAIVVLSVVVVTGFAGQLSLAQFAFAGVGALGAGLLVEHLELPFVLAALIGALITVPIGFVVGLAGVRTRGVALGIVTLGLAVALEGMVFSNPDYTGGVDGLRVGPQDLFGLNISQIVNPERYATLTLAVLVLLSLAIANVRRGRVGRRMIAVRANERAASALGIAVTRVKLYAFTLGAAIAGLGGVFVVFRNPTLNYNDFTVLRSITMLQEGLVGSVGWVSGAALGAGLEPGALGAQVLHLLGEDVERYIFLIGGLLLLAMILQFPNGLAAMHSEVADSVRAKLRRKPEAPALTVPETVTSHRVDPQRLEIEDLTARFGGVTALSVLTMHVDPGEIVGLIGPNGAGKSTAVEGVTGFIPGAVTGRVRLGGERIDGWSSDRRARAGLGRSFQSLELFDDMTVLENLQAASEPQNTTAYVTDLVAPGRARISAACLAAIQEFGLEEYLNARPTELAYGRRRLVAIARAVAAEPSVLLLDEPAAGLDEVESRELSKLISRLARDWGMAVLLIEHDVSMVMRLCDRIYALEFGECIASGSPADIRANDKVVASYLGTGQEETVQN